jgi:hypothetical protein
VLAEYHRCKPEDVRIRILPASGTHSRLSAGLFQKLLPVPILFHRDLGKQKALMIAILHEQAILAHLDLLRVNDATQGREH